VWYNFTKIDQTLKVTPALAAGVADRSGGGGTVRQVLGLLCVCGAVLATEPLRAQLPHMAYDAFMSLDDGERLARFGQLAPANQADLQREHLARWRKLRADSLTEEQRKFLDEVAAAIRPEDYAPGGRHRTAEDVRAFMDRSRRASALFTVEEAAEAFTLRGRLIQAQ
jgi:hypothetical protein